MAGAFPSKFPLPTAEAKVSGLFNTVGGAVSWPDSGRFGCPAIASADLTGALAQAGFADLDWVCCICAPPDLTGGVCAAALLVAIVGCSFGPLMVLVVVWIRVAFAGADAGVDAGIESAFWFPDGTAAATEADDLIAFAGCISDETGG